MALLAGFLPDLQPIANALLGTHQCDLVDQRIRHGCGGLRLPAFEIEILDLDRGVFVAEPLRVVVVEVDCQALDLCSPRKRRTSLPSRPRSSCLRSRERALSTLGSSGLQAHLFLKTESIDFVLQQPPFAWSDDMGLFADQLKEIFVP